MPSTLAPVAVAFSLFGCFWGSWAVAAANVERSLGVSHGGFGLILSAGLAGAAFSNAAGGALAERWGTSRVLGSALVGWAALLAAGAAAPGAVALGLSLVAIIVSAGLVDVVMNVAATAALSATPGRLVRVPARFKAGAAVGAGIMGGLLGASAGGWRWVWAATAVGAAILGAFVLRAHLPAAGAGEHVSVGGALTLLRRERLVLVAAAFAIGAMVEGGVELWGVLYLRTHLASGLLVGSAGAVLGYLVATIARVTLGPAAGRRSPRTGVGAGATVAALGLVLLVAAPQPWLAAAGLVLAAGGISLCWPLLLAHASAGRARPAAVVGGVSAVGYTGFVVGPAVVGWLAAGVGLRAGLLFLAAAAVFVAVAPSVAVRREPEKSPSGY
ncbi:MAG TPA: MFS transporter [Acidimicrobiales bacterium]|nr:MFS transporter [Acidimicrobiales bacterium]